MWRTWEEAKGDERLGVKEESGEVGGVRDDDGSLVDGGRCVK